MTIFNKTPTAEEQVKQKWPNAMIWWDEGYCTVISDWETMRPMGSSGLTEQQAYQNALHNIKTPDTLSPVEEELLNKAIENNSKKTPSKDYRK